MHSASSLTVQQGPAGGEAAAQPAPPQAPTAQHSALDRPEAAHTAGAMQPAANAQTLNAEVGDDLLRQRVAEHAESADAREVLEKAATAGPERYVDVEKGGSVGSSAPGKETVDFLGGFTIDSTFDPDKDVVLRLEFETARQLRATNAVLTLALLVGMASFVALLVLRNTVDDAFFFGNDALEYMNIIAAAICVSASTVVMVIFTQRSVTCLRKGMHWSDRRRKTCRAVWITGCAMLLQEVLWLAPNAYSLLHTCAWFDDFVSICGVLRWSLWNFIMLMYVIRGHNTNPWTGKMGSLLRGKRDAIYLDAPQLHVHGPKIFLWAVSEIPYLLELINIFSPFYKERRYVVDRHGSTDCRKWAYVCTPPAVTKFAIYCGGAMIVAFFLAYIFYLHRAFSMLRSRPYSNFRVGNVLLRLQAGRTMTAFLVVIFTVLFIWFLNPSPCAAFFFSWQGLFPMQVVVAALVLADCASFMPTDPHWKADPILQVWLQQFAWTENAKPGRLAERGEHMRDPGAAEQLQREPMFCFETALKALYWSTLVYRYDESAPDLTRDKQPSEDSSAAVRTVRPRFTPAAGMAMCGLEQVQLFWERSLDTKVLIGWSESAIVVSFRGTASLRNALADLQAWRVAHPPMRGRWYLASRPLVHHGFYRSWTASGLNKRVIAHIQSIVAASGLKPGSVRVLLTGHSLGGAVACLAAHDLVTQCGLTSCSVYTFGAPRPGNRAFRKEYDSLVPDTWAVINDADAVPRVGKFIVLFSRPGQRVIVDYRGDVVVRPSPHEIHLRNGSNPGHHFLASYRRAFVNICRAQFGDRAMQGGREGILDLLCQKELRAFLVACGLPIEIVFPSKEDGLLAEDGKAAGHAGAGRLGSVGQGLEAYWRRASIMLERLTSVPRAVSLLRRRTGSLPLPEEAAHGTSAGPGTIQEEPASGQDVAPESAAAAAAAAESRSAADTREARSEAVAVSLQEGSMGLAPRLSLVRESELSRSQVDALALPGGPSQEGKLASRSSCMLARGNVELGQAAAGVPSSEAGHEVLDKGMPFARPSAATRSGTISAEGSAAAPSPLRRALSQRFSSPHRHYSSPFSGVPLLPQVSPSKHTRQGAGRGLAHAESWAAPAPSPPRPPLPQRASFDAAKSAAGGTPEQRRSPLPSAAADDAQPALSQHSSVHLGQPPPARGFQRPPLVRQSTAPALPASFTAGVRRAAASLGGRSSMRQHDFLAILDEMHEQGFEMEEDSAAPSKASTAAAEHRDMCARMEDMLMPELGSLAARASRLFSQASVAMGIRANPDDEMSENA